MGNIGISQRELASGVRSSVLKIVPTDFTVLASFLQTPTAAEAAQSLELGRARNKLDFVAVPPLSDEYQVSEIHKFSELGNIVCLSKRAKVAASGAKMIAPLHSMRLASGLLKQGQILLNGNYFLFQPSDLHSPWDAYGDPSGLVISDGQMLVPPHLPRPCVLQYKGQTFINRHSFADCQIMDAAGQRFVAHKHGQMEFDAPGTAYALYFGSINGRSPITQGTVDVAYVGRQPTAIKKNGGMPIARSGCVLRYASMEEAIAGSKGALNYQMQSTYDQGLQCGPMLVEFGKSTEIGRNVFDEEELGSGAGFSDTPAKSPSDWKADWHKTRAARFAAGITNEGTVFFLAVEGSSSTAIKGVNRKGATLADLTQLMIDEGAITAMHLDGGGSVQAYNNVGGTLIASHDVYHEDPNATFQIDRPLPLGVILK